MCVCNDWKPFVDLQSMQKRNTVGTSFQSLFLALLPRVFSRIACAELLMIVLCSVRQAPDKSLKHWEPCFFGMKKDNDTWLFWAQESVVIWAIQCIPGQYQGAQWAPTDSWGKNPVIPSLSAGTNCILLHIHLNKVLEASVGRIKWFGYLCEQPNTTSCHALYW